METPLKGIKTLLLIVCILCLYPSIGVTKEGVDMPKTADEIFQFLKGIEAYNILQKGLPWVCEISFWQRQY